MVTFDLMVTVCFSFALLFILSAMAMEHLQIFRVTNIQVNSTITKCMGKGRWYSTTVKLMKETGKMKWLELHVWRQTNKVNKQSKQTK